MAKNSIMSNAIEAQAQDGTACSVHTVDAPPATAVPDAEDNELADALEQAADMVRRGELTSVFMVGVTDESGEMGIVTVTSKTSAACLPILGAIELVKANLTDEINTGGGAG